MASGDLDELRLKAIKLYKEVSLSHPLSSQLSLQTQRLIFDSFIDWDGISTSSRIPTTEYRARVNLGESG